MQNGDQREILPIALSPLPERLKLAKENITDCKGFIVFFSLLYTVLCISILSLDATSYQRQSRWVHELWRYCHEFLGFPYHTQTSHQGITNQHKNLGKPRSGATVSY